MKLSVNLVKFEIKKNLAKNRVARTMRVCMSWSTDNEREIETHFGGADEQRIEEYALWLH